MPYVPMKCLRNNRGSIPLRPEFSGIYILLLPATKILYLAFTSIALLGSDLFYQCSRIEGKENL